MMNVHHFLGVAVLGIFGAAGQGAAAADPPTSGHAVFDAYVTLRFVGTVDSGASKGTLIEATGFDKAVSGEVPFELMSFRCMGHFNVFSDGGSSLDSCVKTDKDGDSIFYVDDNDGWRFVSGTGKYKGISAKGTFKRLWLRNDGALGKEQVVRLEGDWTIKKPGE